MEQRSPTGERSRRQQLGLSIEFLASEAGLTAEQLHLYETRPHGGPIDTTLADKVPRCAEASGKTRAVP
jgi:hypothetical protein